MEFITLFSFFLLRNILLNYAVYDASTGYTQGMSDLVAPVLAILHDEVDAFWCFAGLMGSSTFATTPTDDSMDKSLVRKISSCKKDYPLSPTNEFQRKR